MGWSVDTQRWTQEKGKRIFVVQEFYAGVHVVKRLCEILFCFLCRCLSVYLYFCISLYVFYFSVSFVVFLLYVFIIVSVSVFLFINHTLFVLLSFILLNILLWLQYIFVCFFSHYPSLTLPLYNIRLYLSLYIVPPFSLSLYFAHAFMSYFFCNWHFPPPP